MQINFILFLFIILFVYLYTKRDDKQEGFSKSGLNMSDQYCDKLVHSYLDPTNDNKADQLINYIRVCSPLRKHAIDPSTGNVYTNYGKLV